MHLKQSIPILLAVCLVAACSSKDNSATDTLPDTGTGPGTNPDAAINYTDQAIAFVLPQSHTQNIHIETEGTYDPETLTLAYTSGNIVDGEPLASGHAVKMFRYETLTGKTEFGVMGQLADIPQNGTAQFSGSSAGLIASGDQGQDYSGTMAMDVDFSASQIDINIHINESTSVSQQGSIIPVDHILIDNMTIASDGTFSGGTIATNHEGSAVNITGNNTQNLSAGGFFANQTSTQYETGGVFRAHGNDGLIQGTFIGVKN